MPEEINRVLTDHVSSLLFCPNPRATENLRMEGICADLNNGILMNSETLQNLDFLPERSVLNVGDVMYDVLLLAAEVTEDKSAVANRLELSHKDYLLLTLHRAENTDDPTRFSEIVRFVNDISSGKTVVFPMHARTRKVYAASSDKFHSAVQIISPVGYFDSLALMKHSGLVMTDSGGMQKEAFWLKVPCITLRNETEWVETVESGWNVLYSEYKGRHSPTDSINTVYGDGLAAQRIVGAIERYLWGKTS
jgi:UDP-N-acetylglucosamine 2-epimerase